MRSESLLKEGGKTMVNLQRLITNGEWLGKRVEEEINLESWVKCPSEPPPTIPYSCPMIEIVFET